MRISDWISDVCSSDLHCSPKNPIDMTGPVTTNHDIMEKTLDAVFAANAFDATLIFIGISGAAPSMARPLQQAIANAHARAPDQLVFVSVTATPEMVREYDAKGLLAFDDPSRAIRSMAAQIGRASCRAIVSQY